MPHHPGQTAEQRALDVDDSVFVAQMPYLVDGGYHLVSLAELVDALEGRDTLPNPAVVITFDDGWANQYRHAFPILRHLGRLAESEDSICGPSWQASSRSSMRDESECARFARLMLPTQP
jgi:hypothetical protein